MPTIIYGYLFKFIRATQLGISRIPSKNREVCRAFSLRSISSTKLPAETGWGSNQFEEGFLKCRVCIELGLRSLYWLRIILDQNNKRDKGGHPSPFFIGMVKCSTQWYQLSFKSGSVPDDFMDRSMQFSELSAEVLSGWPLNLTALASPQSSHPRLSFSNNHQGQALHCRVINLSLLHLLSDWEKVAP